MNKTIYNRIRELVSPSLETDSGTGSLNEDEKAGVIALLKTLTADPDPPAERCLAHVEARTTSQPGYLKAYRDGLALLGDSFAKQDDAARDAVLASKK